MDSYCRCTPSASAKVFCYTETLVEKGGFIMSLTALHHCSIRNEKEKMDVTKDFYVDILGMKVGERPPFDFPGYWLYVGEQAVIHIVGIDPDDPQGLLDYLGEDRVESLEGGGAVDHLAFHSDEPDELVARLEEREYSFFQRKVPEMNLHQIFVKDPNDITIELNYFGDATH